MRFVTFLSLAMFVCGAVNSQEAVKKPQMHFMGAYDAGQSGVSIYKMFAPTEAVVCFILMPEVGSGKPVEGGKWDGDGI